MRLGVGLGLFKAGLISAGVRIFSAFQTRVIGDGGTVEAGTCVVNGINGSALLRQASLLLIPSGYKGGKLYAEIPTNGNGDLTWTRGGDAFRTNASGVIQRVPWNLFQYSEDLSNASNWFTISANVTTNTTTAPNGTLTADKLTATATTSTHILLQQPAGSVSGATSTVSIYAKSAGLSNIQFLNNAGGLGVANFNLSAGTAVLVNGVSASIENVGNGWYRCIMTYTPTTSGNYNVQIRLADSSGNTTFLGNGTDGVFLWGAQLVEGTTAQTYLPTTDRLNFPRLSYMYGSCPSALLEPQRTNSIRNSTMVGASTSPSTFPTNWVSVTGGLTFSVVGTGTENGLYYVDVRMNGTASGSGASLRFDGATQINASNGQSWASTFYTKLISATNPPLNYQNSVIESDAIGGFVASNGQTFTPTSSLVRNEYVRTISSVLTARIINSFFVALTSGQSYDFTVRIAQPQMELGAYVTTPIFTSGATATRVADTFSRSNIYTNGLITSSGGTWFMELRGNVAYVRDSSNGFGIGDSSSLGTNSIFLRLDQLTSARLAISKRIAGIPYPLYTTTTDTTKIAIKWNGTSADIFVNGVKEISATAFTITNMDFLAVWSATGVGVPIFIQQMALFPTPLSDTDCATLTT